MGAEYWPEWRREKHFDVCGYSSVDWALLLVCQVLAGMHRQESYMAHHGWKPLQPGSEGVQGKTWGRSLWNRIQTILPPYSYFDKKRGILKDLVLVV